MLVAKIYFGSMEYTKDEVESVKSPTDGTIVSVAPKCTAFEATKALEIAQNAKTRAKNTPLSQRIAWLNDAANRLENNSEEYARCITLETGKPIKFAIIEIARCVETIRATALSVLSVTGETIATDIMPSGRSSMSYFKRVPVGVVVAITPFNFPFNLVAHKLAPALAMGNSVVLKPTPEAPYCGYALAKVFIDSKYAIKDALSVVYGDADVGATLVSSDIPRVISFTGSVGVGKIITQNAGIKKLSLELGGNAATYIDKSANLQEAAKKCAMGAFINSGQVCISLQRIYVDVQVYDDFSALLVGETISLRVGKPLDDDTIIGPLVNKEAATRAKSWLYNAEAAGAKVLCGGEVNGCVMTPAIVVDVTDEMQIVCEEVFAPIVSLIKVEGFDEAVQKINSSPYGLQHSVFTNDLQLTKRAIDELECGGVVINDIPTVRFDIQPYGGVKLSGIGKEGPKFAMEEFSEIKSIAIF
jgi:acyl-CoA reductase-like NAD-dependent aldehyde dehydrogenase